MNISEFSILNYKKICGRLTVSRGKSGLILSRMRQESSFSGKFQVAQYSILVKKNTNTEADYFLGNFCFFIVIFFFKLFSSMTSNFMSMLTLQCSLHISHTCYN